MCKLLTTLILIFITLIVNGQNGLCGEYSASAFKIDTVMQIWKLNLKSDGTYTITSTYYNSFGKWKSTRRKIKLKPDRVTLGCFILENKKETLFVNHDRLVLKERSNGKTRKVERQLSRSAGEKVKVDTEYSGVIEFYKVVAQL